jgi:membrane protein
MNSFSSNHWHRLRNNLLETVQTLKSWPWRETLETLAQRFREDRLGLTASSLTFTTLISLVPMVTVMLAIFSAFPIFASFQASLETYFLQSLVPNTIAKPVLTAVTQFASKASGLGAAGVIVLVFTTLSLMLTIDKTLNSIWRVRTYRPLAQRVLVYWTAVTLGPLLLGISLSMTSYALSASQGLVGALPGGIKFTLHLLEFVLLSCGMAALFHFVPNTPVRWRHAWAGGLFVGFGFELAKKGLAWYLSSVPTYSVVYGAFATVPIFLLWLYVSWSIVLLGAVVAAYAPSLQLHWSRPPDTPGARFQGALALLRELLNAQQQGLAGLRLEELAHALRNDPLWLEPILSLLTTLDWVGRLEEGGSPRYVLLCHPEQTRAQPLIAQILLQPSPDLEKFWSHARLAELQLSELL